MPTTTRDLIRLESRSEPAIALQIQRPRESVATPHLADVIYVHGSTFGADLSIFHRFDGRSWADALNDAGFTVHGFDFAGYGRSDPYPPSVDRPVGGMTDAIPQLQRVVADTRRRNGDVPVVLLAHSWGGAVAARYASLHPQDLTALVLFAPVVTRAANKVADVVLPPASHWQVSQWAQYRRFVADVPPGEPQVLSEAHFEEWGRAYLATDPSSHERRPASVTVPSGPGVDVGLLWSGHSLFDASKIVAPTLIIRGAWDSVFTDADAKGLLDSLGCDDKTDARIERATHLMHLESQRSVLYEHVNDFLLRTCAGSVVDRP